MPSDGDLDPCQYTREQIDAALASIDRESYPINYQRLIAARSTARSASSIPMFGQGAVPKCLTLRGSDWINAILAVAFTIVFPLMLFRGIGRLTAIVGDDAEVSGIAVLEILGSVVLALFLPRFWRGFSVHVVCASETHLTLSRFGRKRVVPLGDVVAVILVDRYTMSSTPLAELEFLMPVGGSTRIPFVPRSNEIVEAFDRYLMSRDSTLRSRGEVPQQRSRQE